LALGALEADQAIMVAVLMVSSLLNIAYLMPIPFRGFFAGRENARDGAPDDRGAGILEAPLTCLVAISTSALASVALFLFPDPVFDLLRQLVTP
jgi:multicomponent Na+:H+ antiporter subunit D